MTAGKKYFLHREWRLHPLRLRNAPENIRFPAEGIPAVVPGTVHTDLWNNRLIPDPFYGDNEQKLQWIQESDWRYTLRFSLPDEWDTGEEILLVFEGLDTVTDVFLNGEMLGRAENMFREFRFAVQGLLGRQNVLQIDFSSPAVYGRQQENRFGKLPVALNSERAYLRKAQYSFGWDWGPSFPTMGIWRRVYLWQPPAARIRHVRFHTAQISAGSARVMVEVDLEGNLSEAKSVLITLSDDRQTVSEQAEAAGEDVLRVELNVPDVRLWWPNGEGEQALYRLRMVLLGVDGKPLDEKEHRVGIRTIHLETTADGNPVFRFVVNGRPVFIRGANWIPADSFLPRVTEAKYRSLLTLARDAHMNMLRVWGGGIYEDDLFYRLCDELGLLVWQDFMFACGGYPELETFLENVTKEAIENVNRLQVHPSLALWCGNNENEWGWFMDTGRPAAEMPGYRIYHSLLPQVLQKLDPLRPYWPSSPYGEEENPNAESSGNRHQWDIWSDWKDYSEVIRDKSLFVTEFGFQAPANVQTLESALPPDQWQPQSRLFEWHNKQEEGNARLFRFLAAHLPVKTEWRDFIYLTQLNQAFALKTCLEHWRGRWAQTSGAIIWQLNDCWPVSSWSLVDSQILPKMAYYFVKRAFAPQFILIRKTAAGIQWRVINRSRLPFRGTQEQHLIALPDGLVTDEVRESIQLTAYSERIGDPVRVPENKLAVLTLRDETGRLVARNYFAPLPWKYMKIRTPKIDRFQEDNHIILHSDGLALFVFLHHPVLNFEEQGFFLLPNEKVVVPFTKRNSLAPDWRPLEIFMLNHYLK